MLVTDDMLEKASDEFKALREQIERFIKEEARIAFVGVGEITYSRLKSLGPIAELDWTYINNFPEKNNKPELEPYATNHHIATESLNCLRAYLIEAVLVMCVDKDKGEKLLHDVKKQMKIAYPVISSVTDQVKLGEFETDIIIAHEIGAAKGIIKEKFGINLPAEGRRNG